MASSRKKMVRFNETLDVKLLREVLAKKTYQNKKSWEGITDAMSDADMAIDGRRVRERTDLLVKKFKQQDRESLKQSGIDEDFTEKDVLFSEIASLREEVKNQEEEVKNSKTKEEDTAKSIRKRAMEGMKKDQDRAPKEKKSNVMTFIKEKHEAEKSLREEELKLKREELELQRQRFELEREERRAALDIQKQQNEMLMMLMNKK